MADQPVKREQILFLSSKSKDTGSEIYNFRKTFPTTFFDFDSLTEDAYITLEQFNCQQSWFNIDSRMNQLIYTEDDFSTTFTLSITQGNYSVRQLATAWQNALNAVAAVSWTITYNTITNKFDFLYTGSAIPIGFQDVSSSSETLDTLGFVRDDNLRYSPALGTTFSSETCAHVGSIVNIFLYFNQQSNTKNVNSGSGLSLNPSTLFASIPVRLSSFFGIVSWENGLKQSLFRSKLHSNGNVFEFQFKDLDGNYIEMSTDWAMTLKYTVYDKAKKMGNVEKLLALSLIENSQ